jgi:3-hydroxyisobutyrate dehydrogenase-like beta-hydroxyacid dehydrogenase
MSTMAPAALRIGLIGYGEVGRIVAEDLRGQGRPVKAYDLALDGRAGDALRAHAAGIGVNLCATHGEVAAQSELIISAVTASQALPAARACATSVVGQSFFLDVNSASPGAKTEAAALIDAAGGRYVEGAIMTSVPPYRIKVPLLLGGAHAAALVGPLQALGFAPQLASDRLGVASATKLCRSVIVKGMEAMIIESLTAARHYGVEDRVLASLAESFPGIDWEQQARYFFQRVIQHGRRRAEELLEVAQTVRQAGLTPFSASGTAERQAFIADLADAGVFGDKAAKRGDWRVEADRILDAGTRRGA